MTGILIKRGHLSEETERTPYKDRMFGMFDYLPVEVTDLTQLEDVALYLTFQFTLLGFLVFSYLLN